MKKWGWFVVAVVAVALMGVWVQEAEAAYFASTQYVQGYSCAWIWMGCWDYGTASWTASGDYNGSGKLAYPLPTGANLCIVIYDYMTGTWDEVFLEVLKQGSCFDWLALPADVDWPAGFLQNDFDIEQTAKRILHTMRKDIQEAFLAHPEGKKMLVRFVTWHNRRNPEPTPTELEERYQAEWESCGKDPSEDDKDDDLPF